MIRAPDDAQARAADPRISAFVTANAGSGKTKTLIDRVARLLLAGAAPDEILCVTYTKAAAAEMQTRLFDLLGDWSVLDDERLRLELSRLEGRKVSDYLPNALSAARALFARALETPGGLRIQTLHAFCEKLLRRFPLEARVSPGFEVLDDLGASQLKRNARTALARHALDEGDGRIAGAYARLSVDFDHGAFEGLFDAFAGMAGELKAWLDKVEADGGLEAVVWTSLTGSPEPLDSGRIETEMQEGGLAAEAWLRIAEALDVKGASKGAKTLADLLAAHRGAAPLPELLDALFTQKFTPKPGVGGPKALSHAPALRRQLDEEMDRLQSLEARRKQAVAGQKTLDILLLARAWLAAYEIEKEQSGKLDFGDLIDRTLELTGESGMAAWVLYKLDQKLAHVLVDEAQDTSPAQWSILNQLTGEFFAGAGRPGASGALSRSLFVVGDEKQSIYSFQGASPDRMEKEFGVYRTKAEAVGAAFERIELKVSWRSTRDVLDFVDGVFEAQESRRALLGEREGDIRHLAQRTDRGCIDLWDLVEPPAKEDRVAWTDPAGFPGRQLVDPGPRGADRRGDPPDCRGGRGRRKEGRRGGPARPLGRLHRPRAASRGPVRRDPAGAEAPGRPGWRRRPAEAGRPHPVRGPEGPGPLRPLPRRRPDPGGPAAQSVLRCQRCEPVRPGARPGERPALGHPGPPGGDGGPRRGAAGMDPGPRGPGRGARRRRARTL